MIKGLYEVHLQVSDPARAIEFYQKLGLQLALQEDNTAFMWIVPRQSWIGLWQAEIPHLATKHLAFQIDYADMQHAFAWLKQLGITPVRHKTFEPIEPVVRPMQANGSVYFNDPDANLLELICNLPEAPRDLPMMYLSEWEKLAAMRA
jgi:catechol 2,3-dioxygenase-like lactoylglutathione lyase family enzyme